MISDFLIVLMTKQIQPQLDFYKNCLGLDVIFEHSDSFGLGKSERIYIILRVDNSSDSHHVTEQKGPTIMTFTCSGDIEKHAQQITAAGYKVRERLQLSDKGVDYLFAEDADANEICLDFSNN